MEEKFIDLVELLESKSMLTTAEADWLLDRVVEPPVEDPFSPLDISWMGWYDAASITATAGTNLPVILDLTGNGWDLRGDVGPKFNATDPKFNRPTFDFATGGSSVATDRFITPFPAATELSVVVLLAKRTATGAGTMVQGNADSSTSYVRFSGGNIQAVGQTNVPNLPYTSTSPDMIRWLRRPTNAKVVVNEDPAKTVNGNPGHWSASYMRFAGTNPTTGSMGADVAAMGFYVGDITQHPKWDEFLGWVRNQGVVLP